MTNQKDEQADHDGTANDISDELKIKLSFPVTQIVQKIKLRVAQRNSPLLVSIDGGSSAGKSTIAILVAAEVNGVIIQGDDFYQTGINWSQLSLADRVIQCIDWNRAQKETIEPLLTGQIAYWHPFNFKTEIGFTEYFVVRKLAPVIIIDGIYFSNPQLADLLDFTILIDTPADIRYLRHNEREGNDNAEWHNLWMKQNFTISTQ